MSCIGYTKKGLPCNKKKSRGNSYCGIHCKTYKFDKPEDCPICMESLQNENRPLECGHWVHKECILKWNDICPTCRTPLSLSGKERKILNSNTNKDNTEEINRYPITIEITVDNIEDIFPTLGDNISASGGSRNNRPEDTTLGSRGLYDREIEEVNFEEWLNSLVLIFNNNNN